MHLPVMVAEAVRWLDLSRGGCIVDCTVGLGGHAAAILDSSPAVTLLGLDRDTEALQLASERLARFGDRARLVRARFDQLQEVLADEGIDKASGVLADLGVSSLQLDAGERGFSFRHDGPLDMRMGTGRADTATSRHRRADAGTSRHRRADASRHRRADRSPRRGANGTELTAKTILNRYPEAELSKIFRQFGEERYARRIASTIVAARKEAAIETTTELCRLVERAKPRPRPRRDGKKGIHPATQVFQALRIEVNQELDQLGELLDQSVRMLDSDGRLVVISYHSLEDRVVKHTLRDLARGEIEPVTGRPRAESRLIEVLTRKPLRPTAEEVAANARSRSARLRAARRL